MCLCTTVGSSTVAGAGCDVSHIRRVRPEVLQNGTACSIGVQSQARRGVSVAGCISKVAVDDQRRTDSLAAAAPQAPQRSADPQPGGRGPTSSQPRSGTSRSERRRSPRDAAPYLAQYNLDEDPFAPAPDPRFFFHAASHEHAAQELLTAIRDREGIVLVTGPGGVGKTTLCRTILEELDRRTFTSYLLDAPDSFDAVLATGLVDVGVISRDELERRRPPFDELLRTFREFVASLGPLHASAVLFVDDAHKVPRGVLSDVAALADKGDAERLLQIVLIGDPDLERELRERTLKPIEAKVAVRCRIAPLEPAEIASYVRHRLATAGPKSGVSFSDAALARLHDVSRGVPGAVNQLCSHALELAAAAPAPVVIERKTIDAAARALGLVSRWPFGLFGSRPPHSR